MGQGGESSGTDRRTNSDRCAGTLTKQNRRLDLQISSRLSASGGQEKRKISKLSTHVK
jgi:hypothetical protein